ncbi:hypothetical protein KCU67_g3596, partial [Aureobasidium melanogenum]
MNDTTNIAPPGNAGQEPLIFSGRNASPTPSDTASVASYDSGLGPSLFDTDGNDEPEVNYYSDDSEFESDSSSTTEDANPPGEQEPPCTRQDCTTRIAQQMSRITILEEFVQLRARHYTAGPSDDLQHPPRQPRCIHEQIQVLEEKEKEIRELLAEGRRQKDVMSKREAEMDERIVDVGRILDQVQQKEESLSRTHEAITTRMKNLDKRLELVRKEETDLAKRKKELQLRQEAIEQQTEKLENSQGTFKKQSAMLSNLLRQQHETKTALDRAKETLEAHEKSVVNRDVAVTQREVAIAQREVAAAKREYIMVQREKALLEHEQAVHRFVAQHQQSEAEFKQRMQFLMQQSLQNTVADMSLEENGDAPEPVEEVFTSFNPTAQKEQLLIDQQESVPEEVTSASHAPEATTPQPSPSTETPVPSAMIPPVRQRRDLYGRPDSRLTRRIRN